MRRIFHGEPDAVAPVPLYVFWLVLWADYYGIILLLHRLYISEPYGAAIMRVYFPTLVSAYFSNRPPGTTRAYVFWKAAHAGAGTMNSG